MSQSKIKTWGGQTYNAPSVEVIEIESEQPVFTGSNDPSYGYGDNGMGTI